MIEACILCSENNTCSQYRVYGRSVRVQYCLLQQLECGIVYYNSQSVVLYITISWIPQDPSVQKAYTRRNEMQLNDSAQQYAWCCVVWYCIHHFSYFERLAAMTDPAYMPTDQVLYCIVLQCMHLNVRKNDHFFGVFKYSLVQYSILLTSILLRTFFARALPQQASSSTISQCRAKQTSGQSNCRHSDDTLWR